MLTKTMNYDIIKLGIWRFIEKFDGKAGFGLGDARAYISALTDIVVLEQGLDYVSALMEALRHAEAVYSTPGSKGIGDDSWRG